MAVLVKSPERVQKICSDIVHHFREKVEPSGHKAMVVTFDQEACLLYKAELDKVLPPEASDVVISATGKKGPENEQYRKYDREREAEEKLLERYRDPADPLKVLIVTAKLLTGFDAPILQAMYLDKPLRDHTLLQAICRTNRTYADSKTHGLIVDYLGVFDDVAQALQFDDLSVRQAVKNFEELKRKLPVLVQKCLGHFPGVDRTLAGFEGLMAAQECLPNNEARDAFALDFSNLMKVWEALSPDPILDQHETDYRWLAGVYESVQPSTGTGKLYWHSLGAKTIELIHRNVHVQAIRDDLDMIVVDSALLEEMLGKGDPRKKAKEIEIKLADRLRKRASDPKFKALAERLEALKEKHEKGLLASVDFLKALLTLAKDTVAAEKEADEKAPASEDPDRGKAALTALFEEVRTQKTPIIVARVVADIDAIVKPVRFDGWQRSTAGERDVKQALRKALLQYKLHTDQELFDRAYGYIKQYY
jgi:type I restriction enzyme R subunit